MHIHVYLDLNTFNNHVLAPTRPSIIMSKISTSVTMNKSVNGTLSIQYSHCLEESFSLPRFIYLCMLMLCYRLILYRESTVALQHNKTYSKQIHASQSHEMYREAIILNVFYNDIHVVINIYSKQCDIDISINKLSLEAYVLDKYVLRYGKNNL